MRKNRVTRRDEADIHIMALDDDPMMTQTIQAYFEAVGYSVDTENDPERAIERLRETRYDILLLDFLMSPISGDMVVERVRQFDRGLFIVLLTGHKSLAPPIKTIRELDIQGYYEKSDRFDQLELLIESCVKSIRLMRELRAANDRLASSYYEMAGALRLLVDAKDIYTRGHSDRVAYYAVRCARAMGKDDAWCERLRLAGLFHDIGKVGVADEILQKPGRLTDEEFAVIRQHPVQGDRILSAVSMYAPIAPIVRAHHERWDGRGYPDGLAGEAIPEESRIIAVADSFDAMTSSRRYRPNMTLEQAIEELRRGRGTQFEAAAADAFLTLVEDASLLEEAMRASEKMEVTL